MVQTMTIEELLSLKDYGRNIGYLVNDSFNNKFCFTLRYPECNKYDVVFDYTYHDRITYSVSTQTAEDIIHNFSDYDGNVAEYNYKAVPLEVAKNQIKEKWIEYKNYLNDIEVNKIGEDFQ